MDPKGHVASLGELLDQVLQEEPQALDQEDEEEEVDLREHNPEEYLFELIEQDKVHEFREFLHQHPEYPVNHRWLQSGRALLHHVCVLNRREMLKILLEHDELFLLQRTRLGSATALHLAVDCDHRFIVFLLLSHGADPHARDRFGCTPLHYIRSVNVAKLLFQYGARVIEYDQKRRHVLHWVHRRQQAEDPKPSAELLKLLQSKAEQEYKAKMNQARHLRKDSDSLSTTSSSPKVK